MPRATLSVVLFVKNEAHRIAAALETVRWANEIIIIDDASTDDTAAICRAYGAHVIPCEDSQGYFYKRRNFGFAQATSDWILMMDPDERVTPDLRLHIEQVLQDPQPYTGYTFWRQNYFWGQPLRHGGWYHKTLRLFRRGAGRDRGLRVHSPIEVDGPIGHVDAAIEHYPFQTVTDLVAKQNFYTDFEAKEIVGERQWPARQLARRMFARPLKVFWKMYIKKRGFSDGLPGFVLAAIFSWVELLRWAKCLEQISSPGGQPVTTQQ